MATDTRKDRNKTTQTVTIRIEIELWEQISKEADSLDMAPRRLLRNLVYAGWDDYQTMRKTGLLSVFKGIRKITRKL